MAPSTKGSGEMISSMEKEQKFVKNINSLKGLGSDGSKFVGDYMDGKK